MIRYSALMASFDSYLDGVKLSEHLMRFRQLDKRCELTDRTELSPERLNRRIAVRFLDCCS